MIKKICCIILIIIMCLSFTACWSKEEPKELAIILSIVYDIDEQENYPIIVEILDTQNQGSGGTMQTIATKIVKFKSATVPEGIRDTRVTIDRTLYGAHNKVRFFTERLAQKGLIEISDFFLRDHLADENPLMIIVKNEDPMLLYKADKGLSNNLGSYVDSLNRAREQTVDHSVFINILDFIKDYYSEGKQPVLGVVEAVPDEAYISQEESGAETAPKYILTFNGIAVFKEDKLIGYLDKLETRVYHYLINDVQSAYISWLVEDNYVAGNCIKNKVDIKTSFSNGIVNIDTIIDKELMIAENNTPYNVTDINEVQIIEEALNDYVKDQVEKTVAKVQTEFKSDIFGFGQKFHMQHPDIWKAIKANWDDDYFTTAQINVTVNSKVNYGGEIREKVGEEVGDSL